jgi:hypothetical protein
VEPSSPPLPEAKQFVVEPAPTEECVALPKEGEKLTFKFRAYYEAKKADGSVQQFVDATNFRYAPITIFYTDKTSTQQVQAGDQLNLLSGTIPELIPFEDPINDLSAGVYDEWTIEIPGGAWMEELTNSEIYILYHAVKVHGTVGDSDFTEVDILPEVPLVCIKKGEALSSPPQATPTSSAFPACLDETDGCLLSYQGNIKIHEALLSILNNSSLSAAAGRPKIAEQIPVTQFDLRVKKDSVVIVNANISYKGGVTDANLSLLTAPTPEVAFDAAKIDPQEISFPAIGMNIVETIEVTFNLEDNGAWQTRPLSDFPLIFDGSAVSVSPSSVRDRFACASTDAANFSRVTINLKEDTISAFDAFSCLPNFQKTFIQKFTTTYRPSGGFFDALGYVFPDQKVAYGVINLNVTVTNTGVTINSGNIIAEMGNDPAGLPYNPNADTSVSIPIINNPALDPPAISLSLTKKP